MASPTTGNLTVARLLTSAKHLRSISWQLLGSLSRIHKIILWIILILNVRSLPFAWHSKAAFLALVCRREKAEYAVVVRVFWPIITLRLHFYRRCFLPYFFKSRAVYAAAKESWYDSITPVGSHPFEYVTVHKSWAGMFPKPDRQILALMLMWCSFIEASTMAISWAI
jgi:hypothetical protein